jgi:hypothetical protein
MVTSGPYTSVNPPRRRLANSSTASRGTWIGFTPHLLGTIDPLTRASLERSPLPHRPLAAGRLRRREGPRLGGFRLFCSSPATLPYPRLQRKRKIGRARRLDRLQAWGQNDTAAPVLESLPTARPGRPFARAFVQLLPPKSLLSYRQAHRIDTTQECYHGNATQPSGPFRPPNLVGLVCDPVASSPSGGASAFRSAAGVERSAAETFKPPGGDVRGGSTHSANPLH